MAGARRDQVWRGWNCDANRVWWDDDGWPEKRRRSTGVHSESRGFGERCGDEVMAQNRPAKNHWWTKRSQRSACTVQSGGTR